MKNNTFYQQKSEIEHNIKLKELEMKHIIENSAKTIALVTPLLVLSKKLFDKPEKGKSKILTASFFIALINRSTALYRLYRQIIKSREK